MRESMIIYESAYKAINYLPDEKLQLEAFKGLMEYGFYGTVPESENPFVNMIFVQAIPSMRSAAERYEASVENGKKGGRPASAPIEDILQMKHDGMTNRQIAEKLGCSEKNIEKRISTYNRSSPTNPTNPPTNPTGSDGGVYPTNPTNLTVSVSDTVSESISYTDTSSVSMSSTNTASHEISESDTCPEGESEESNAGDEESELFYFQGDWKNLPEYKRKTEGRRIRDLSDEEYKEILQLLDKGELSATIIEHRYGMRDKTITKDFKKSRELFMSAYTSGRLPRKF